MLFPYTNLWQVFLQPRCLQLFLAQKKIAQIDVESDAELASSLDALLAQIPSRLPFVDSIEFILDSSQLHYLIVPWQQGMNTPVDRDHYAIAFHLQQQGQASGPMRVAFTDYAYGKNGFAALMDKDIFELLGVAARRRRLRFTGCRSQFDVLWRKACRSMPDDALFACMGPQQSSFALRYQHQWHSVFSLHLPTADTQTQLETANRLTGLPPLACFVIQPDADGFVTASFSDASRAQENL